MKKFLNFISLPFKYDTSLCIALAVILFSVIPLHCSGIAPTAGIIVLAGLYLIVATNLTPRYYAIATPVMYVMTIILLSYAAIFPEGFYQTPWMRILGVTVSPIWFAGFTVTLVMSFLHGLKNLTDIRKASFFGIAITILLVLVASLDVIRAILLAVAVCCSFYACGIGKSNIRLNCIATIAGIFLYIAGLLLFGDFLSTFPDILFDSYTLLRIVPVLTSIYVVYQSTRSLRNMESTYVKLLGIGTAYILLAESTSDFASSMLSLETYSSAFIHCALYGVILSCIGYRKNTVRIVKTK